MNTWYGACLVFETSHDLESVPTELWEERVVLVHASDVEEARALAWQMGTDGEHEYEVGSPAPHMLRWRFKGIESLYEILADTPAHGTEVYSRLLGTEGAAELLKRLARAVEERARN
jgi:hypothetical protein